MAIAASIYLSSLRETKPYTAIMADIHIDEFDAYYYTAETKYYNSIATNIPATSMGKGWNETAGYSFYLLPKDASVNM